MNNLSHLYVAAHQSEMRTQAAQERLAARASSGRKSRIGSAAKSVWSLLSGPAERPALPTLTNYPYRGLTSTAPFEPPPAQTRPSSGGRV